MRFYIKWSKQMFELKLNVIDDEKPHLIYALGRSPSHPLIRNHSQTTFPNS